MLLLLGSVGLQACGPESSPLEASTGSESVAPRMQAISEGSLENSLQDGPRYPLQGAPLTWVEQQELVASDGVAEAEFGRSVGMSGDTALIGAPRDASAGQYTGAAYVFVRNGATWVEQQKLTASDKGGLDYFGTSVAVDGNTALIGSSGDDDKGSASGSVYVFVRNATAWLEQQKLLASDGAAADTFGRHVSLQADTALIGADGDDDHGSESGAAYVFVRNATTWLEQDKLTADTGTAGDRFGVSVSLSGETALIGAHYDDDAASYAGSAYVFVRNATTWGAQQKLMSGDGAYQDFFGISVSVDADTAAIGAYGDDDQGSFSGSTYLFVRSAIGWTLQQKLTASDGAPGDRFGKNISLDGDVALIGAIGDNNDLIPNAGSAYVFVRSAAGWNERSKLTASDGTAEESFGEGVCVSADKALIGATGDDTAGSEAGSAYSFTLKLSDGEACTAATACASGYCIDGRCCAGACDGACEACDMAGVEGTCAPAPKGSLPASNCNGYLCGGDIQGCPVVCAADGDCSSEYYCQNATACLPKAAAGKACLANVACSSGHCVDNVCCDAACDGGCGSCVVAGREGICSPLAAHAAGVPSCAPFLCGGQGVDCLTNCGSHQDCSLGNYCVTGACQPASIQGSDCTENDACGTGFCTDGICCAEAACGAYRCGSAGACQDSCTSSAQCAQGHQCNSIGKCEQRVKNSGAAGETGGCHLTRTQPAAPPFWHWLAGLALLSGLATRRKRRRPERHSQA